MNGFLYLLLLAMLSCLPAPLQAAAMQQSIAFYYSVKPPVDELAMFSRVVVEPENVRERERQQLLAAGNEVFAYVSIGEARRERTWFADTQQAWVIGENRAWNSAIMDMANPDWQSFIIERLVTPLARQGYDGLFLDTLDSYQMATDDPARRHAQEQGLATLIRQLHSHFPKMKILLNRGFEVVADVHSQIDGVVAESLYRTWDPVSRNYLPVSPDEHHWLKQKLDDIRKNYDIPVYVIDYVKPSERTLARATAKKIAGLGFIPWISDANLDMLGVSTLEIVPRRMLVLYDSAESDLPYSQAHRYLATPLEYMGYMVEYVNIRDGLPDIPLNGRYAGIVSWFTDNHIPSPQRFVRWLERQMDTGVPVAFLGTFGMQPPKAFLERLGLETVPGKLARPVRIVRKDAMAAMEAAPYPLSRNLFPVRAMGPKIRVHESIEDARHARMDVIATAPWGGMALTPYVLEKGLDEQARWKLDIFHFLHEALHLEPIPAFDTTTENGRRLLMTHIDGDGAASRAVMPGSPLAMQVIRDRILKRYPLPATVSVITGEIETGGLYPKRAKELQKIARSIFAMPQVEIASHTYSHPFSWATAASDPNAHLPVPGYTYSLDSEVTKSVDYINKHLAPPGKRVKVFLWSGDALPDEKAMQLASSLGLRNMNGGNTVVTRDNPSLTEVSSMDRPVGSELQVYAPVMNENLYTHHWTRPRYGFERVIETFKLTDMPRRLKPIDIYYHFYSGSETASLKALQQVYDWCMRQQTMPVWVSEYADKVLAYAHGTLARRPDGSWLIMAPDAIRTLRLPKSLGWPDMTRSRGIAGVRDLPQGRYVHLAPGGRHTLVLGKNAPHGAYLVSANARLEQWQQHGDSIRLRLHGHLPIRLSMSQSCALQLGKQRIEPVRHGNTYDFALQRKDTGDALLTCR